MKEEIEFKPVERRILLILNNNGNRWLSSTEFYNIINKSFSDGLTDKKYRENWVYINLRRLAGLGLLEKKETRERGRISFYKLSSRGKEVIEKTFNLKR